MGESTKTIYQKKNIYFLAIFIAVFIAILALTFKFIVEVDWSNLSKVLVTGFSSWQGWMWIALIVLIFALSIIIKANAQYARCSVVVKVKFTSCIEYSLTTSFLAMIGTMNLFDGAYSLYWMKKHHINTSQSFAFVLYNNVVNETSMFILFIPAYIYLCTKYPSICAVDGGILIFWIMTLGLVLNTLSILVYFFMGYSRKFAYWVAVCGNWFKKIFKMHYHTKQECHDKYFHNKQLRNDFFALFKNKKATFAYFFKNFACCGLAVLDLYAIFMFVSIGQININPFFIFVVQTTSGAANRFSPTPGGVGTWEMITTTILTGIAGRDYGTIIHNSVFISRFDTIVFNMAGLGTFIFVSIKVLKEKYRKHHITQNKA